MTVQRRYLVSNLKQRTTIASSARKATNYFERLRGLLFTKPLIPGEGLYLAPCQSIHMFCMTYTIDALFLSKAGVVIGCEKSVKPWRISKFYTNAYGCLELPEGTIDQSQTSPGDQLIFKELSLHESTTRNAKR
jgi:uncharacterized membrane protein (UPF0127 family)